MEGGRSRLGRNPAEVAQALLSVRFWQSQKGKDEQKWRNLHRQECLCYVA